MRKLTRRLHEKWHRHSMRPDRPLSRIEICPDCNLPVHPEEAEVDHAGDIPRWLLQVHLLQWMNR